jgi:DNA-binding response OmpR family regulator
LRDKGGIAAKRRFLYRNDMRLLLIEDSERLRRSLVTGLRTAGYAVDTAADGETGLWMAQEAVYDVILLDLMLPIVPGLKVLEQLRAKGSEAHVLILTARDAVDDRVKGLRAGADDYLPKPFAFDELLARVEALCRRAYGRKAPRLEIADLVIDRAARAVTRGGTPITLAPREFALLEFMALRAGEVVSRTEIEAHLYDENTDLMSNAVDAAVYSLRRRIQPDGRAPLLHTRRGHGYVLAPA